MVVDMGRFTFGPCSNGLKMESQQSAGMPTPVSTTSN